MKEKFIAWFKAQNRNLQIFLIGVSIMAVVAFFTWLGVVLRGL